MNRIALIGTLLTCAAFGQNPVIEGYMRAQELARQARELKALEAQEEALRLQTQILRQQQQAAELARSDATASPTPTPQQGRMRVKVEVESSDPSFGEQFESRVASDLRSLGDVVTVQENASVRLRLNLLKLEVPEGAPAMYLMSYVASSAWTYDDLEYVRKDVSPPDARKALLEILTMAEIYEFHGATPVTAESLGEISKRVAAAVDNRILKHRRSK